jgi:diaminohydroxyphosphoribosylaminopyrimidine deaminase/5-amino-6-(5-phosphoribosylamino)uracil reductase
MARALELARRGLNTTDPNPRVGCVVVKDGRIVGEAWHERAGEPHAEVLALNAAAGHTHSAGVYLTLEPCCHTGRTPPCTDALIRAGVRRVVAAMRDPNPKVSGKGFEALTARGIEVAVGLMEKEAEALNPGFILRMREGRPLVRIKLAASLDGRTAMADGTSQWITGEDARADVQSWRARSSAVLTGVSTILHDNPLLTVRRPGHSRQPLRVVLDSQLRLPPAAVILRQPGATLVVTASTDAAAALRLREAGAEVMILATPQSGIDLAALMRNLAAREINEVLVESGATLAGSFLQAGLVDELIAYYAPHIMGSHERGMFNLPPLAAMGERAPMEFVDVRMIGKDLRVIARPLRRQ